MEFCNYIKRPQGEGLFFEGIDQMIYSDEYITRIDKNSFLYKILRNAIQNGVFFRNTKCKISKNYWMPLSNAGLPSVKKSSHLHELTFFFHDLMHNNFNDLMLLSTSNENDISIYMMHRVAGEAVTLALSDWLFIDSIYNTLSESEKKHIHDKKLYDGYLSIKEHMSFSDILKAHIKYAVLGDRSGFEVNGSIPNGMLEYLDWFEPVYVSDIIWTYTNAKYIKSTSSIEFDDYVYRNKYKFWSIERFKEENNISSIDTKEVILDKIMDYFINRLDFVYKNGDKNIIDTKEITTRAIKNFIVYQSKIVFDYNFDGVQTKEYLSDIQRIAYSRILTQNDVHEHINKYSMLINQLFAMGKIQNRDKELYKQVYPFFTYKKVSYDTHDMKESLIDTSKSLIKIKGGF